MSNLEVFFNPRSVAIIGASEALKFGQTMTQYLLDSAFKTFPVNIAKEEIFGHKAYKNINEIEDDIELAIIVVKNEFVLQSVRDCLNKGVKGIIIESAGFSETGDEELSKIQQEIEEIIKQKDTRIIGPNCVGVTNFSNKFTTTEVNFNETIDGGKVSVIAQSGVLGNIFVDWAASQKIGLNKVVTLGNKIDVDEIDILDYLENDQETKVIVLYLEGVKRGKEFINRMKTMTKPVLIMKNGRSEIGSRAIKSHTGSIAGNDKIYDSLFQQLHKVYRVDNFYEMFNIANAFATQPLLKGKNIAVITSSGSLGALTCDLIDKWGLHLANLKSSTMEEIISIAPNWISARNPVDLGPSSLSTFRPSLKLLMNDPNVDGIINIFAVPKMPLQKFSIPISPQLREMKILSKEIKKPIITCVYGSRWVLDYFLKYSEKYSLSIMTQVDHAVKAYKMMHEFGNRGERR
ncbi:MAG: acetyl-CoA synthetase [Promethearchaeota archaeon]|nr:MAG: acetyl-CoA synthetase [Candidatus Lokiarchaeota archaeon]